jgi:DnaJ-class molecular chaperone
MLSLLLLQVLSDAEKRKAYDTLGRAWVSGHTAHERAYT